MGLSETILAAIIGALATMATAIVQILRNRAPVETRPKKNRVRSTFSIIVLVLGAMAGGYFYSQLKSVDTREEIAALRADLKLAAQSSTTDPTTGLPSTAVSGTPADATAASVTRRSGEAGSAESMAHLPPCQVTKQAADAGPTACSEILATKIALCALIPSGAQTGNIHVEARVPLSDTAWMPANAGASTLGSLHLSPQHTEYSASPDKRSVCLDVANWSVEDTLAVRVVVDYAFPVAPAGELTAAAPVGQTL
jgi:hypothetical protein